MIGGWSGSEQVQCAVAPAANGLMAAAVAAAWRGVARAVVDQSRLQALQRLNKLNRQQQQQQQPVALETTRLSVVSRMC